MGGEGAVQDLAALAFDRMPVGLLYAERRAILRCNEALAAMFGFTRAEIEGRSIEALYPSREDYESRGAAGLEILRNEDHYEDERVMARRDGSLFWCRVTGRSLTPADPYARSVWCFVDLSGEWSLNGLSPREREIATLAAEGRSAKDMAHVLGLSPRTVEAYIAKLRHKLKVRNIAELVGRVKSAPTRGPGAS